MSIVYIKYRVWKLKQAFVFARNDSIDINIKRFTEKGIKGNKNMLVNENVRYMQIFTSNESKYLTIYSNKYRFELTCLAFNVLKILWVNNWQQAILKYLTYIKSVHK